MGLFWASNEEYNSLFKRYEPPQKTVLSEIQKQTKTRMKERQQDTIKKHDVDEKYLYLMIYLVNMNTDFNYHQARVKFGMTEEQIDEGINFLVKNDYVVFASGKIKPTGKLKKYVKTSKIKKLKDVDVLETPIDMIQDSVRYLPRNFESEFSGYKS